MGVLRARVGGQWIDIGGTTDAVWVDPNAPTDPNMELWYDTDALSVVANPLVSGRNLLDNGQMAIKQRTVTSQAGSGFLADRWQVVNGGVGVTNAVYSTLAAYGVVNPAGRPRPGNVQYIQLTTAEAAGSLAAGDFLLYQQVIEGQNLQHLNWGTPDALPLVYSFDIYSAIATTYVVELVRPEATQRTISRLLSVPAGFSTQWVTVPGDTTTPITNDNVGRLTAVVWLGAGSTYTTGVLQTAWGNMVNANRAAGISNAWAAGVIGSTFSITNAQLEVGTVPTPYEVRRYDEELRRAMRYFRQTEKTSNLHGEGGMYGLSTAASQTFIYNVPFPVPMRAIPTATFRGAYTTNLVTSHQVIPNSTAYTVVVLTSGVGNWSIYSNNNGYVEFATEI
jgi:hypothetical protein